MKRSALLPFVILMFYSGIAFSQFTEAYEKLSINNIETGFSTNGSFFWNGESADYSVPKTDSVKSLFAGGLWMGGIDANGQLKVAAQTYRQTGSDYWPGMLDTASLMDSVTAKSWDKIWRITKYQVEGHIARMNQQSPVGSIETAILDWPAKGNTNATGKGGVLLNIPYDAAPFFDADGDGLYNPIYGDYPDIKGDEMLWYVFNDDRQHGETGSLRIRAEIQVSVYGYNCPDDDIVYNTLFIDYKVINKGDIRMNSFYIGKWIDVVLGCFLNDYVGCDTSSNTFYVHNGSAIDSDCGTPGYGANPPIQTITFLDQVLSGNQYYNNDQSTTGNPETVYHFYNYLTGRWKDDSPVTYGGTGYGGTTPTTWMFPGNPSDSLGWSECAANHVPADRRMVGITGPFTLNVGQSVEMTLAFSTHFLPHVFPCPDFTPFRQRIDSLQFKFDNNLLETCAEYHFTCDDPDSTGFTCVWPGDGDDNGIANIQDIFPIGIGYGDTFAVRPNASTNWIGQPMQDWPQSFTLIGQNYKHADCNGDARIDSFDFQPILDNYGLVHFKGSPTQKTGLPLYLEVQQGSFSAGSTVSVDILLGTQDLPIPDFYAIALSVAYNKEVVQPGSVTLDYSSSWAGTKAVDLAAIHKEFSAQGRLDVGVTRIDKANRAGFGRIATISYILIDDIAGKDAFDLPTLSPWIVEAKAIRNDETEIGLFLGVEKSDMQETISVYPNPTNDLLNIEIPVSLQAQVVRLYDSVGKELFTTNYEGQKLTISTADIPGGIYFLEVSGKQQQSVRKISVIK